MKHEDNLFEFSDFEERDDSEVDSEFDRFFEKDRDHKGFSQWDLEYDDV